jgi:hypothetical protein
MKFGEGASWQQPEVLKEFLGGKKFSPLFPNSNSYEKQVGQQSP